jgi:DNA polymerase-3 subunit delta'
VSVESVEEATRHHPHARAVLAAAAAGAASPSHAYLFHGPPGAGKADPGDARRRALAGVHPDLTWVRPTGAAEMLVGDVDEAVVAAATRTPFESRRRVFVLERADTLIDQAANRLLKTLEEPPPFVHLILLAGRLADVLPTIRSRCLAVRFEALTAAQLADHLIDEHACEPELARSSARLARGDARQARMLVSGPGRELRRAAEAYVRTAVAGDALSRAWKELRRVAREAGDDAERAVSEEFAERAERLPRSDAARVRREGEQAARRAHRRAQTATIDGALGLSALWLRDMACVADGGERQLCNSDRIDALREDAGRVSGAAALREGVLAVEEARTRLIVNPSEELLLEALALRLGRTLRVP